jgi:hypothetical protein
MFKITRSHTVQTVAALALAAVSMSAAMAQTQTLASTVSATLTKTGPRTGANGTKYMNIEGNATGFGSFGVADFAPLTVANGSTISSLMLSLTESDVAYTAPGSFDVFLVSGSDTATSGLKYDGTVVSDGIGSQLGTLYNLGTFTFSSTGVTNTGQVDTYTLTLPNAAANALFVTEANAGTLRLAIGADTASTTAATYLGSTGTTPPSLSFTSAASAVPEASSALSLAALLALGLTAGVITRRKRSTSAS